jgi:hypothetical protein
MNEEISLLNDIFTFKIDLEEYFDEIQEQCPQSQILFRIVKKYPNMIYNNKTITKFLISNYYYKIYHKYIGRYYLNLLDYILFIKKDYKMVLYMIKNGLNKEGLLESLQLYLEYIEGSYFKNKHIKLIKLLVKYGYKNKINFNLIFYKYTFEDYYSIRRHKKFSIKNCAFLIKNMTKINLDKYINHDTLSDIFADNERKMFLLLLNNGLIKTDIFSNKYTDMYYMNYNIYKWLISLNIDYMKKQQIINCINIYELDDERLIKNLIFKENYNLKKKIDNDDISYLLYVTRNYNYVLNFII